MKQKRSNPNDLLKGYKIRLYPNKQQAKELETLFTIRRVAYNIYLEYRKTYYTLFKKPLSTFTFATHFTKIRNNPKSRFYWLTNHKCVDLIEFSFKEVDEAYAHFFRRRKEGHKNPGFPKFKKARTEKKRFSTRGSMHLKNNKLFMTGFANNKKSLGGINYRDTNPFATLEEAELRRVTVSKTSTGKYYAAVLLKHEGAKQNSKAEITQVLGIDRGVCDTLMDSDGVAYNIPAMTEKKARQKKRYQRRMSRMQSPCKTTIQDGKQIRTYQKPSNNYLKMKQKHARLMEKEINKRKYWIHAVSTEIARKAKADNASVAIEDLKIQNMTKRAKNKGVAQKKALNKSILEQNWYEFESILNYKLDEVEQRLIKVKPHHTSRLCSNCGTYQDIKNKREYKCHKCGLSINRDFNAALNIKRRGEIEVGLCRPKPELNQTTCLTNKDLVHTPPEKRLSTIPSVSEGDGDGCTGVQPEPKLPSTKEEQVKNRGDL